MTRFDFPILLTPLERRNHLELRTSIPWRMIEENERQAIANHGQTLERLAERGGLSYVEAVCVLEGRCWTTAREMSELAARERLDELVALWMKTPGRHV